MIVKLLLDAKREGREIPASDIADLIAGYTRGDVPDYQMAAFAMAVCCKGMSPQETHALTDAMRRSGASLAWPDGYPSADKHSTGGVGDKLSFIVQPLAAACGVYVPSLAGRGLGLTGGTIDKLEAIPGYDAQLSLAAFQKTVMACGVSLTAQTAEIAPADKKLYALRDVTGSVPSIPLIVASILSKKLAEGANTLVFDVKCGKGAFMATREQARTLAQALVSGAKAAGRKAAACVTAMDAPLGFAVGNALEVDEALAVLSAPSAPARTPPGIVEISLVLAAHMVSLAREMPYGEAFRLCQKRLDDGSALARFLDMVSRHGGDIETFKKRPPARHTVAVTAAQSGYISAIDAAAVARGAFLLGAGRAETDDRLDLSAGIKLAVQCGDRVKEGDVLAQLFTDTRPEKIANARAEISAAVSYAATPATCAPYILDVYS